MTKHVIYSHITSYMRYSKNSKDTNFKGSKYFCNRYREKITAFVYVEYNRHVAKCAFAVKVQFRGETKDTFQNTLGKREIVSNFYNYI